MPFSAILGIASYLKLRDRSHSNALHLRRHQAFRSCPRNWCGNTEVPLDSADRVDIVNCGRTLTVTLEVKSLDSDATDLRRSVFQCIKNRAVMEAMDIRSEPQVVPVLVTQKVERSKMFNAATISAQLALDWPGLEIRGTPARFTRRTEAAFLDPFEQGLAGRDGCEYQRHARGRCRLDLLVRARPLDLAERCVNDHEPVAWNDAGKQDRHCL